MKKWIRLVSMCAFALTFLLMSPVYHSIAHAGTVLTEGDPAVAPLKLNVKAKDMVVDTTFTLRVYNVTETQKVSFKSSDAETVKVSKKGVVTALKSGIATITATVKNNNTVVAILTCDINVGPRATSLVLRLPEPTLTLECGKKTNLSSFIFIKPKNTTETALYSSLNPDIAVVSPAGKITAKSAGTAIIRVEISNGKFVECTVTVIEPSESNGNNENNGNNNNGNNGNNGNNENNGNNIPTTEQTSESNR